MMKQKALILDIDGTLTNSKKEITPKTLEAMRKVQEAGHILVIASGRPTHGVKWISDVLQLEKYGGYILNFNGARITNVRTGEVVFQQLFPPEYIKPVYEFAVANHMGLVTYENDDIICATEIDEYIEFEARLNQMQVRKVVNFTDYVNFDINKCLFTAKEEVAPMLEKELCDIYEGKLSIYRSEPFFIEAMPLGVDKAASLDRLFQMIGVAVEDTIACGDGFNDMSMISYAGIGVAMANAQEEVKAVADVITQKTNDEDGLVEIVEKYLL